MRAYRLVILIMLLGILGETWGYLITIHSQAKDLQTQVAVVQNSLATLLAPTRVPTATNRPESTLAPVPTQTETPTEMPTATVLGPITVRIMSFTQDESMPFLISMDGLQLGLWENPSLTVYARLKNPGQLFQVPGHVPQEVNIIFSEELWATHPESNYYWIEGADPDGGCWMQPVGKVVNITNGAVVYRPFVWDGQMRLHDCPKWGTVIQ